MITLATDRHLYYFCSSCRAKMVIGYSDGDVLSMKCPDQHESFLNYKTFEGFKKYAIALFSPKVGMGVKE